MKDLITICLILKWPRQGSIIPFFFFYLEYGEKQCASAFWNGELESELRELERLDFFGLMKKNEDREKVMEEVEKIRAKGVYPHSSEDCSDACIARGEKFHWYMHIQPVCHKEKFKGLSPLVTVKLRLLQMFMLCSWLL